MFKAPCVVLVHIWNITHWYVRHDSWLVIHETWHAKMLWDMAHWYTRHDFTMRHDSLIYETWLGDPWDMSHVSRPDIMRNGKKRGDAVTYMNMTGLVTLSLAHTPCIYKRVWRQQKILHETKYCQHTHPPINVVSRSRCDAHEHDRSFHAVTGTHTNKKKKFASDDVYKTETEECTGHVAMGWLRWVGSLKL